MYRWKKLFERRRSIVYSVGATLAAFLLGFAFTIVALFNSNEARRAAERAKSSAMEARRNPTLSLGCSIL